jgi:predicted Zn-dependent protease
MSQPKNNSANTLGQHTLASSVSRKISEVILNFRMTPEIRDFFEENQKDFSERVTKEVLKIMNEMMDEYVLK